MTTKPYHHGNLRAALVEAGAELARTAGPDGVVLREVARRTGVSHNAAYRHFADRDELLGEIADVASDQLEQAMQRRLDGVTETDPALRARARLRATGRAYVEFALAEPGLFTRGLLPDRRGGRPSPTTPAPYVLLGQVLDELVEAGALSPDDRMGADVVCWAAVHGLSVLLLDGPLRDVPAPDREAVLEKLLVDDRAGSHRVGQLSFGSRRQDRVGSGVSTSSSSYFSPRSTTYTARGSGAAPPAGGDRARPSGRAARRPADPGRRACPRTSSRQRPTSRAPTTDETGTS